MRRGRFGCDVSMLKVEGRLAESAGLVREIHVIGMAWSSG